MDTKVTYKGLPLVRNNNENYYGDPSKEYIVYIGKWNIPMSVRHTIFGNNCSNAF